MESRMLSASPEPPSHLVKTQLKPSTAWGKESVYVAPCLATADRRGPTARGAAVLTDLVQCSNDSVYVLLTASGIHGGVCPGKQAA